MRYTIGIVLAQNDAMFCQPIGDVQYLAISLYHCCWHGMLWFVNFQSDVFWTCMLTLVIVSQWDKSNVQWLIFWQVGDIVLLDMGLRKHMTSHGMETRRLRKGKTCTAPCGPKKALDKPRFSNGEGLGTTWLPFWYLLMSKGHPQNSTQLSSNDSHPSSCL